MIRYNVVQFSNFSMRTRQYNRTWSDCTQGDIYGEADCTAKSSIWFWLQFWYWSQEKILFSILFVLMSCISMQIALNTYATCIKPKVLPNIGLLNVPLHVKNVCLYVSSSACVCLCVSVYVCVWLHHRQAQAIRNRGFLLRACER